MEEGRWERRRHYFANPLVLTITIITALGFLLDRNAGSRHGGALAQIPWTPIYVDTTNRLDLWTKTAKGCECPNKKTSKDCACCVKPEGCLCSHNLNRCTQCGLEDVCQRFCNVTISSRNVATKSGLSWVHVQSPSLEGPTSCWWRLESAPGQRIEVQVHRLLSVGSFDNGTQKCNGGFLQFADGDNNVDVSPQAIQLCAENSRYSPPVVMFGDRGIATMLLRLDARTTRSQLAAYVSFSSADDLVTGDPSKGGKLRPQSVCDWTFHSCWNHDCILASPGFPGLFPPNRRCRYHISANSTNVKIRLRFHVLSFPQPPLCATHHVAIWRSNFSSLLPSSTPWKKLCQRQSTADSTIDIDGGQAYIEFRSGYTSSPYVYNGFRASVRFLKGNSAGSSSSATAATTTIKIRFDHGQPPLGPLSPSVATHQPISSRSHPPSAHGGNQQQQIPHDTHTGFSHAKTHHTFLDNTDDDGLLGYPRASHEVANLQPVSCGHVFDGEITRGNLFRLIIPRNFSPPPKELRPFGAYTADRKTVQPSVFRCQLVFKGKATDVVQVAVFNYKFRGSNCSTVTEVYDMDHEEDPTNYTDRLLGKLCGPSGNEVKRFTSSHSRMSLITIVYPFPEPIGTEFLEGAFRFHDETVEGTVKPMSSCEVVYYGVTSAPTGHITGPPDSPLLRLSTFPLVCAYTFNPGLNQSVTLTFDQVGHELVNVALPGSRKYCRTFCSSSGCRCESKYTPMDEIDHLSLVTGSTPIACLCGYFPDFLPLTFESHAPLMLVYHATKGGNEFTYSAKFNFQHNITCANFTIAPPSGSKRWREALGDSFPHKNILNHYTHFQCSWNVEIPDRYKLTLEFVSEENQEDCRTWNLTLQSDNSFALPSDRSDLHYSFCPKETRKEFRVPETVHSAFVRLSGVASRPPQFEIRWKYTDQILGSGPVTQTKTSSAAASHLTSSTYVSLNIFLTCFCIHVYITRSTL